MCQIFLLVEFAQQPGSMVVVSAGYEFYCMLEHKRMIFFVFANNSLLVLCN